jgi:serine/threonine protein kinase
VTTVGNFEIQAELERGTGYALYSAMHSGLGRPVLLKVITAGASATPQARQRFVQEAALLRTLDHPSVQTVLEVGEAAGQPYVALEPAQAQRLSVLLQQRTDPLPAMTVAQIALHLAGALEHAHERGVVHRDVSLGSVLLQSNGVPLLTDFGYTKDVDPSLPGVAQTGRCMGTPGYSAPEQATGQIALIGPASDIYGLGAVLYTLLVRQTPIRGNSPAEILAATATQQPAPPHSLRPDVPPALEQVCLRCLAKAPADRFRTATELRQALDGIILASSQDVPPPPAPTKVSLHAPGAPAGPEPAGKDFDSDDYAWTEKGDAPPGQVESPSASGRRRGRKTSQRKDSVPDSPKTGLPLIPIVGAVAVLLLVGVGAVVFSGGSKDADVAKTSTDGGADDDGGSEDNGTDTDDTPLGPKPKPEENAETLFATGLERLGKKNFEGAIEALDKVVALDSEFATAFHNRGNAHYQLENFEAALADFNTAVELRPKIAEAFHNQGAAAESLGRLQEAIAAYDQFLKLKPKHPQSEGVRADLKRLRGELKKKG